MNRLNNRLERPDLMAKQIVKLYNQATDREKAEGATWYTEAHNICNQIAHKFNCPITKVAGVVAALSPATNWQQNIADAHNLVLAWHHLIDPDEVTVTTYGPNKRKAIHILNLKSSNQDDIARILLHNSKVNKTTCFYWNILKPGSDKHVTVDRHAIRIALGSSEADNVCITEKRYRTIAESYHIAANKLHLGAIDLQAIVWVAFRRISHLSVSSMENEIFNSIVDQIKNK